MRMKFGPIQWILIVVLFSVGAGTWWRLFHNPQSIEAISPSSPPPLGLKQIIKGDYVTLQKDKILLSDETEVPDLGYMSALVGELSRGTKSPLMLFKTLSCWECSPEVLLRVFDPLTRQFLDFPHPQRHSVGSPDLEEYLLDREIKGAYGECLSQSPSLFLAVRSRQVDSDGQRLRTPESWDFETIFITLDADGRPLVERTPTDGFGRLSSILSASCVEILMEETTEDL